MTNLTADDMIRYGQTTAVFLKSEIGEAIFAELQQRAFAEFKSAQTPQQRELVWCKARALDELKTALQAVVDAGEFEQQRRTPRPQ